MCSADEVKEHPFFKGIDWQLVYLQKYPPPLIPPRGEVNAADAFDIGSFDEEDTKGIKLTDTDQELYKHFSVVISERWQQEIAETVFEAINQETDKIEMKRRAKLKNKFEDEKESDCILHGYIKKLGGPFASAWQTRYAKLYPNRLELHSESTSSKPEVMLFYFCPSNSLIPILCAVDIHGSNRRNLSRLCACEGRTIDCVEDERNRERERFSYCADQPGN